MRAFLPAALALLALLGACQGLVAQPVSRVVGRWQRVGPSGVFEPSWLSSEYVEFLQDGTVLTLLRDVARDEYWTVGEARYSFPARDRILASGSCWRGWERYDCAREYRFALAGDTLRVFEGPEGDSSAVFVRIAPSGAQAPPTLAPPQPSATPLPRS